MPKKRTALGRFKHEGAAGIVNKDGRYVVYSGDDERFDYVYKFVTEAPVDGQNRDANRDILDRGTLYVARYDADGTGRWLPLVHGQGPLTEANGFRSQADVVIEARRAADLLGATKMDRPEDVEANPKTDKVYVMLTNNSRRTPEQVERRKPARQQPLRPHRRDDPRRPRSRRREIRLGDPGEVRRSVDRRGRRDLLAGNHQGRLVRHAGQLRRRQPGPALDRDRRQPALAHRAERRPLGDGDRRRGARAPRSISSAARAAPRCAAPISRRTTRRSFSRIQHPGEADDDDPNAAPATYETPSTRWPDFKPDMPPRPSIVVVTKRGGGKIAG